MKRIINYLIDRKLLVNLLVVVILLVGLMSVITMNRQQIPDVNMDMVTVTTIYPGASPSDAEELISIPIEKKLRSVSDVKKVRAYNVDNVSLIVVYILDTAKDKKKTIQDIKDAVEQVENLPSGVQKPIVAEVNFENTELMHIAFTGINENVPYSRLREFAKISENFFYDVPGVAKLDKLGYYDREFLVEIYPENLKKYRIGMNTICNVLKMRNVDYPGGPLRIGDKEFILRTKGQFKNADEVRNTVIRGNDAGNALTIGDIAKVTDTYEEADVYHRVDGKKAVVFKVWKQNKADQIVLSELIHKAISAYSVPGYNDVKISTFSNKSTITATRISSVVHEAVMGFIVLGLFMFLLLGRRMSSMVLAGIPITFMLTFAAMKYIGININVVSLFAMIMVMGMMVDFSIVAAENCHRLLEHGMKRRDAVFNGVTEVFWSVTVTLICIIAAFVPLLLITGSMGKFIKAIPIVIIAALIGGWIVAMFITPTYLNMFLGETHKKGEDKREVTLPQKFFESIFGKKINKSLNKIQKEDKNYEEGLFGQIQKKYKNFVESALNHRYILVGILIIILISSVSLIPKLGFKFLPNGGEEEVRISLKLPFEINLNSNLEEIKKYEKLIIDSIPKEEYKNLYTYAGSEFTEILDPKPGKATYKSTIELYLVPEKDRKRVADEISLDLRNRIAQAQENGLLIKETKVKVESIFEGPPIGKPISVEIRGDDFEIIKKIAAEYKTFLDTINGVRDTSIDLESGKTEYRYTVNEKMAAWTGISAYDIATSLNASFMGAVTSYVNQNEEQIGVRVRFEESAREKMKSLNQTKVANMTGGIMPLDSVSDVNIVKAYSAINRLNYRKLVQVQGEVDIRKITPVDVVKLLEIKFADIEKRYPGYLIAYGGEQEDTNESMDELKTYFIAALIFIFIVITIFMNSLIMPLIIMGAIPFAIVGVIFALLTHGQPFTFMSILGMFSLAGIIVSNTLVLVQFINQFRDEGLSLKDAIIEGGVVRLRPIILTAGAMVLELLPVIYGLGGSKDYLVSPLALAFGYGLIFATFITLILVPCLYHIAEDAKGAFSSFILKFGIKMDEKIYQPKVKVPVVETVINSQVPHSRKKL